MAPCAYESVFPAVLFRSSTAADSAAPNQYKTYHRKKKKGNR